MTSQPSNKEIMDAITDLAASQKAMGSRLERKIDGVEKSLGQRLERVEGGITELREGRIARLEKRVDAMEERLASPH